MTNCKNCNKPFQPTFNKGSEQLYCSIKCRQENAQKRMYERIKNDIMENSQGNMEKPTVSHEQTYRPSYNHNELMDLKIELERMKYEQKIKDIENGYVIMMNQVNNQMQNILNKMEERENEYVDESPNDFEKIISGIAPLILERIKNKA
jgi:hypothetical protein